MGAVVDQHPEHDDTSRPRLDPPAPNGGELTPAPPAGEPARFEPAGPRRRPPWRRLLRSKSLRRLVYLALVLLALTWAYDHYFGGDDDAGRPAAETGGGKARTNYLYSSSPHEAVRMVYDDIAQKAVENVCLRFDVDRGVDQQFADNVGYADCSAAAVALGEQVTHVDDYAESVRSFGAKPITASELRIDSCDYQIEGGPALGVFTLTKQSYKDQWLITGHEPGPKRCPEPTAKPTR